MLRGSKPFDGEDEGRASLQEVGLYPGSDHVFGDIVAGVCGSDHDAGFAVPGWRAFMARGVVDDIAVVVT